ncbi:MAG: hypothetical protein L3J22_08235 [Xanthomonadales bacterium]|nr:hypothetical protein [Xanthomonadales bacterium]
MNPSELDTLAQLASELGMDKAAFRQALISNETDNKLHQQIQQSRGLGVASFPSLVFISNQISHAITLDYRNYGVSLEEITKLNL